MRSTRAALITLILVLTSANTALATWGNKCSQGNSSHCYGIASWAMSGSEQVEGLSSNIDTEYMNVYEWASGAVVNNEQWASFNPKGWWVEDGQEAGWGAGGQNCCSLRWFTAYNNSNGYSANESPWPEQGWTMNPYTLQSAYSTGGPTNTWCFQIGQGSAGCVGGVATYSNEVQVGMEVASNGEPVNSGKDETGVLHLNGNWYPWNKAKMEAVRYGGETTTHVCVSKWQSTPGYINFGTC